MTYNQLTTEEFIKRAKAIHGNIYDYSKTIYKNMNTKVIIICSKHGEFQQIAGNHINPKIKAGCPYCAKKKVFYGETDLESQYPTIAKLFDEEKNGISAKEIFAKTNKKYWWKCDNKLNHYYKMSPNNKISKNAKCPICSGQQLLKGFNDLLTKRPDVAKYWDYDKNEDLKPDMVTYGSGKKVWWKCEDCGRSYQREINVRIRGNSCSYCHPYSCISGINDIVTISPELAKEWSVENKVPPNTVAANSHKKYKWVCPNCNSTYECSPHHRQQGSKCIICHMSLGELAVMKILNEFNIKYKSQESFPDCKDVRPLEFDFTLYDNFNNLVGVIEYNGLQHYQPNKFFDKDINSFEKRQQHDNIKRIWCLNIRNIPLLEIPYASPYTIRYMIINFLVNLHLIERTQEIDNYLNSDEIFTNK